MQLLKSLSLREWQTVRAQGWLDLPRLLRAAVSTYLALTIAGYAGLVCIGRWQLDEYYDFYLMRGHLSRFFVKRLWWSPRIIEEPLLLAYGWLVNSLHRPLIIPFLGLLWAGFVLSGLLTFWLALCRREARQASASLLVALTLMALFVAGGQTTEVFYWPCGAVAYLPTLSAILLLFLQAIDGRLATQQGKTIAGLCLFIAAGTSEMGATFAFCYALMQLGQQCASLKKGALPKVRSLLWWAIPFILSTGVLLVIRFYRFRSLEMDASDRGPALGHAFLSAKASLHEFAREIVVGGMANSSRESHLRLTRWLHSGWHWPVKILFGTRLPMEALLVLGLILCWSPLGRVSKDVARQIMYFVAAALSASLITIFASILHFGTVCCDRHILIRQCWILMAIAGTVVASSAWIEWGAWQRKFTSWAPLLFLVGLLSLGYLRPLTQTYRISWASLAASNDNFRSGFTPGNRRMTFWVLPSTEVVDPDPLDAGIYTSNIESAAIDPSSSNYPYIILNFFGKETIEVRPVEAGP